MGLKEYTRKRDFSKTPEPSEGSARTTGRELSFVVQKHDASRLHYDLRLELDGVLKSWAVPKGPSLDPGDKRLAVQVEDHPLGYAGFEGAIPEGQYGGGTVMLWDEGTWAPLDGDPAGSLRRGKLSFAIEGRRLRGKWTLARMGSGNGDKKNWLLIKQDDDEASPDGGALVKEHTRSVRTKRTLDEIAAGAPDPAGLPGARKRAMPREVRPQLCTLVKTAPSGDNWLHEIKFDGYRFITKKKGKKVTLLTRTGKDWTHRFGPIVKAIGDLGVSDAVFDGEAAITDSEGRTSFQKLQQAIKGKKFDGLVFFVFDLLYLDGHDLMGSALIERKRLLRGIIPALGPVLRYSDHVEGGGQAVEAHACRLGLEGVISKRADSVYSQGRSKTWLKIKCGRRQEFVVIGYTPPTGARKHFGSLLLGVYDRGGRLVYAGKVGTGFTATVLRDMARRMRAIERKTSPADLPPTRAESRGARWVEPELVAEVAFSEWTEDNRLRHPSFQGLREDKEAKDVTFEVPKANVGGTPTGAGDDKKRTTKKSTGPKTSGRAKGGRVEVADVELSSPGRVLYPDQGLTKRDLAAYYEAVAALILPHIKGRPLSTVRCPRGRSGTCFFQKHVRETFTGAIEPITVEEKEGKADYISVDSVEGLITLVQFGVLEIHPWGASLPDLEQPDLLTFDLDPGEGSGFDAVREGAALVRDVLAEIGLESFLKASGGKGLHVVVPLGRRAGWDEAKAFAHGVARRIASDQPKRYTAALSKSQRKGKVFIDYLRNGRGATAVSPFSTRARAGASVAAPLAWDELELLESPAVFTATNLASRLDSLGSDPWEGFFGKRQQLTPKRLRAMGVDE